MDCNPYELGNFALFYQYYSSFTLCITWFLAPLIFYTILTQSKSLGPIKWLFLSHSFWCLMLETLLGIVKPVVFGEIAGGYSIGLFKDTDSRSSAIAALLCLLFVLFSIGGLVMTIQNRYATIFDIKILRRLSETRSLLILASINYPSLTIICFTTVLPMVLVEKEEIQRWATEYDLKLVPFLEQPTFFMIPHEQLSTPVIIVLVILIITAVKCIISGITFGYSLRTMNTKATVNKRVQ
ncbi:hypothetical protein FO519_008333, partial [Halicephalobus sp. NKZ332]